MPNTFYVLKDHIFPLYPEKIRLDSCVVHVCICVYLIGAIRWYGNWGKGNSLWEGAERCILVKKIPLIGSLRTVISQQLTIGLRSIKCRVVGLMDCGGVVSGGVAGDI